MDKTNTKKGGFKATLGRIIQYAKPHKAYFFLACIFDLISVGLNMFVPIVLSWGIDKIVGFHNVDFAGLGRILILIFIQAITSAIFEWLAAYFEEILTNKTSESIRSLCFKKLNSVPLKYIDNTAHGDIMSLMINDIDNVSSGFLSGIKSILSGMVTLISCTVFMLSLNWQMTIVVTVLAPLSLLISVYITRRAKRLNQIVVEKTADMSAYCEEMITNQKVIQAYNIEKKNIKTFNKHNKILYENTEQARFFASLAGPGARFIDGSLYGIIGCVGALFSVAGKISVGTISAFLGYVNNYTTPYENIANILADLHIAIASAERVFEMLDEKDVPSDRGKQEIKSCNGNIQLKNVYFSYTPQVRLIQNFNLAVTKGQHVAIVGPTGCGKSTLINLLMRFYDVNEGKIILSGKNINDVTRNSVRSCYGMVLQESWLYNATIRENIAYGKPDATMEEIVEASKLAGAHAFIEKLPNGYETMIEENAGNISAGQKQLLCIARIMLTKPPMLILDEATSNIDTHTEQKIQEAFDYIMEGRTTFMVAHRLSTIVNADIILVMNKGNIVEQGTHQELLEKQGFYYKLYNSQFGQ